jgi:hypothetical protein
MEPVPLCRVEREHRAIALGCCRPMLGIRTCVPVALLHTPPDNAPLSSSMQRASPSQYTLHCPPSIKQLTVDHSSAPPCIHPHPPIPHLPPKSETVAVCS